MLTEKEEAPNFLMAVSSKENPIRRVNDDDQALKTIPSKNTMIKMLRVQIPLGNGENMKVSKTTLNAIKNSPMKLKEKQTTIVNQ